MKERLATPASIAWLIAYGRELLSQLEGDGQTGRTQGLQAWQGELLRQQSALRWRSRSRFPRPDQWLWTDVSLAQASDHWSAAFKAALFPGGEPVIDACCGAGSDLVALAARGEVLGIDADPALAALAADNARAHGHQVEVRAMRLPAAWPEHLRWLSIDPDRRASGQRTTDAHTFSPPLEQVLDMSQRCAGAVIKLAPSTRTDEQLAAQIDASCQRVWLGNQGECRQLLLLSGELRQHALGLSQLDTDQLRNDSPHSNSLRSAVLCEPPGGRTEALAPHGELPLVQVYRAAVMPAGQLRPAQLGSFVFDLHPTLHAADLHAAWASQHGLRPVGESHGYYTGDSRLSSPWAQGFEVLDVLAWDDRKIRKWLRSFGAGPVEVKARGLYPLKLQLDANACQRRYSVADGIPLTLLVTRIGERLRGIAARRLVDSAAGA